MNSRILGRRPRENIARVAQVLLLATLLWSIVTGARQLIVFLQQGALSVDLELLAVMRLVVLAVLTIAVLSCIVRSPASFWSLSAVRILAVCCAAGAVVDWVVAADIGVGNVLPVSQAAEAALAGVIFLTGAPRAA